MDKIVNLKPLSEENGNLFQRIWGWFVDNRITTKEPPQVTSDGGNYHVEGLIGIDESHGNDSFPLGAVMLEEILHYVLSSEKEESSGDFSPEFLHSILALIVGQIESHQSKREFQSILIGHLWKLIESSTPPVKD